MADEPTGTTWKIRAPQVLGIGALVAGGITVAVWLVILALLIGPLVFWLAWNALEFGPAIGFPELGFWATILATAFLVFGWFGKMAITGAVFVFDPGWFNASAQLHWPEPTLRNFVAIALLAALAGHHSSHGSSAKRKNRKPHDPKRDLDGRARTVLSNA